MQTTSMARADAPRATGNGESSYPIIDAGTEAGVKETGSIKTGTNMTGSTTYIPMVNTLPAEWPAFSSTLDESLDFAVEQNETVTRLIQLTENGGQMGQEIDCGNPSQVEVFVFGHEGASNRLSDVAVQVVHVDKQGNQQKEIRWTRVDGDKRGSVQFRLEEYAEVSIVEDAHGQTVASESIKVTSKPLHINNSWLSNAGYCQDEQSCWTFRNENTCQGQLSWNIVFKQK
ncbi:MAG: hypothetical protein AAF702_48395 [Chloroflexota bacterium]